MNKVNWKIGPGYKQIDKITLPAYEELYLDNGIKTILINQGSQEVFKIDIVYTGARLIEHKKIVSKLTSNLLREGTKNRNSLELSELFDFYGAHLKIGANLDYNYLSVSGLTKHFEVLMGLLHEVLYFPTFDESELDKNKRNTIQKLQLDLSKNEIVNYRIFTESLFGKDHVYGYNSYEKDISLVSRADLVQHHSEAFGCNNCFIIIGGNLKPTTISILNKFFGQIIKFAKPFQYYKSDVAPSHQRLLIPSKNEHQASIRIGRKLFNRHHEDFNNFFVLNTILGGYFGSRLMTRIREDLGYTYNIFSIVDQLIFDGYFYIETEVTLDNIEKTINEIYNQIEILKSEPIEEEELKMVKNYLTGNFLNLVDGPLNTLSFIRTLETDNTTKQDFDLLISNIRSITPQEIQSTANKYLNKNQMIEVIVGNH